MRLMDGEILMEVTITGAGTVGQRGTPIRLWLLNCATG